MTKFCLTKIFEIRSSYSRWKSYIYWQIKWVVESNFLLGREGKRFKSVSPYSQSFQNCCEGKLPKMHFPEVQFQKMIYVTGRVHGFAHGTFTICRVIVLICH